ncbi:MAG: site-specific DNA-methyltransferase [Nitrososphaerota archaeon]|nr:site-specific DNA-methyltransferase [Nitrososphaerota archaeon]
MGSKGSSGRIEEYVEESAEPEEVQKTEIPKQFEFYKVPKRFGSIPVDELPLGCDKDEQYHKVYPRLPLPFQKADRISFGSPKLEPNRLFWGDNLHVMRMLPSESIDLVYMDPPFFSGRIYNVIFGDANEIRSFSDIWEGGMPGYLIWLNARILEMKRLLKPTGSIFVHCDWHASHYIKAELDKMFGYDNFRAEIVWKRGAAHSDTKQGARNFGHIHDSILFYTKTDEYTWSQQYTQYDKEYVENFYSHIEPKTGRRFQLDNLTAAKPGGDTSYEWHGVRPYKGRYWAYSKAKMEEFERQGRLFYTRNGMPRYKRYLDEMPGVPLQDFWTDINPAGLGREAIGYPTQKPETLMARIINASSNPGDVIADFFCGGGTTPVVAQKLGRRWIACDSSRIAISISLDRLLRTLSSSSKDIQTSLSSVPDISLEYWGNYEIPALAQMNQQDFAHFIISAYNGRVSSSGQYIHGFKSGVPLFVGPASQDRPVKKEDVIEFAREISTKRGLKKGDMLAWAFSPAAQEAASRLNASGMADVDLIRLKIVRIDSQEFREHVTSKHKEYSRLLTFILPPEVRLSHKRLGPLTYEFNIGESISVNPGGKIANVQWDFDFKGTFVSTPGYSFMRDAKKAPILKVSYEFERAGKQSIACRVQDDIGGEKTHVEVVAVQ